MSKENHHIPYVLGLDIGMASVGAALLAQDHILGLHVRAFDKAEVPKTGEPLNKVRRDAKSARKRLRRRAFRLLRLTRAFKRFGLLSNNTTDAFSLPGVSPWQLRAEGLERQLSPKEWATVLYHILKHRGFMSSRKSESIPDEKTDDGRMLLGVNANKKLLVESKYQTAGELAWKDERFRDSKRNKGGSYTHTFDRSDLRYELHLLFDRQVQLGNAYTSGDFRLFVDNLLMARRPAILAKDLLGKVGSCSLLSDEKRAPKASHTAERFVWLSKINNLRISEQGDIRPLTDSERLLLLDLPFLPTKSKPKPITYQTVRKLLELADTQRFTGLRYPSSEGGKQDKDPEKSTLFVAKAFNALREAYQKANLNLEWERDSTNAAYLDMLGYARTVYKDDDEATQYLLQQGVIPTIVDTVLKVNFEHFMHLSLAAMQRLLSFMREGLRFDEATLAAGLGHHSHKRDDHEKVSKLPAINRQDFPNPVVYRALNQARKLVNALIDKYGLPERVHIELARDLGKPKAERDEIKKEQDKFAQTKEDQVNYFIDLFKRHPRKDELIKWRLYREQQSQCPYCGGSLHEDNGRKVIDDSTYAQIDHVLPYSRSFDDSMNNKVLVHTRCNQNKGNQTPYEYLKGEQDSQEWIDFCHWVDSRNYRQAKRDRLLRKNFSTSAAEGFLVRNLTDTRYICRAFKNILEEHLQLADGSNSQRCVVVSGALTSLLRARWGLPTSKAKREASDLHHAMDAAVVAACGQRAVQYINTLVKKQAWSHKPDQGGYVNLVTGEFLSTKEFVQRDEVFKLFPPPWSHFRSELLARLSPDPVAELPWLENASPVLISRAAQRRKTGALHEARVRSKKLHGVNLSEKGSNKSYTTVHLQELTLKKLDDLVDKRRDFKLFSALQERLKQFNDDGKAAFVQPFYKPTALGKVAPIVRTVKLMKTQNDGLYVRDGIVDLGDMHHVDVFSYGDHKFWFEPVYPVSNTQRVGASSIPEDAVFLFSLTKNDYVKITIADVVYEGYFVMYESDGRVTLRAHDQPKPDKKFFRKGISAFRDVQKFHVDVLGNIYPARNETRQPLKPSKKR